MRFAVAPRVRNGREVRMLSTVYGPLLPFVPFDLRLSSFDSRCMLAAHWIKRYSLNEQMKPILYKIVQGVLFIVCAIPGLVLVLVAPLMLVAYFDPNTSNRTNTWHPSVSIASLVAGLLLILVGIGKWKPWRSRYPWRRSQNKETEREIDQVIEGDAEARCASMIALGSGMKKLKKLFLAYLIVVATTVVCDKLLFYLTGVAFRKSQVWLQGKLVVNMGVPSQNYWRTEVIFYSVMFFIIATILVLYEEKEHYSSAIDRFLRSKKINTIIGIVFMFCSFGFLMWAKRTPDVLSVIMVPLNVLICLMVLVRWVAKEIYLLKRRRVSQKSK